MKRSAGRLILPVFALITAGCGSAPQDGGATVEFGTPALNTPPLALDSLSDGPPPVAASDPPPVARSDVSPAERCDPNYTPCVPIDTDVDCKGGKGNGPSYVAGPVRVVGSDPYRLDGDGDGVGCES
jgi:hypothetical protein